MNCSHHPQSEAVAQCKRCGVGVCQKCAKVTEPIRSQAGTLCLNCYARELNNRIAYNKQEWAKTKKHLIGTCIFAVAGIVFMLIGLIYGLIEGAGDFSPILLGYGIFGITAAVSGWKAGTRMHEEEEAKNGPSYTVTSDGIYRNEGYGKKLIVALLGLVFAIFIVPTYIIRDVQNLRSCQETDIYLLDQLDEVEMA